MKKIIATFFILITYSIAEADISMEIQEFKQKVRNIQLKLNFFSKNINNSVACEELKKEGEILFSKIKDDDIKNKKELSSTLESLFHRETDVPNINNACNENLVKAFYYKKINMRDIDFAILYVQGDYYQDINYEKAFEYIKKAESNLSGYKHTFYGDNSYGYAQDVILGQFYEFGIGTKKDISKAISYYKTYFDKDTHDGSWIYAGLRLASYYGKSNDKIKASEILDKIVKYKSLYEVNFMKEKNKLTEYSKYIPELENYPLSEYLEKDYSGIKINLDTVIKIYKIKYNLV